MQRIAKKTLTKIFYISINKVSESLLRNQQAIPGRYLKLFDTKATTMDPTDLTKHCKKIEHWKAQLSNAVFKLGRRTRVLH